MGSEGYLINQFIAAHTNHRTDEWGGAYENRIRMPLEIVKGIREKVTSSHIQTITSSTFMKSLGHGRIDAHALHAFSFV
jgi:2,4-dienoyl-CoA reductase-like NADH-dependent reductase (Old Yellow Enzyme family)